MLIGSGGWNAMRSLTANRDWSGDDRPDRLATTSDYLVQYKGLGTGGLGARDKANATWWGVDTGPF